VFWSMPIISLFIVLRAQIVRVILGTGSFDWSDTRLTAAALALFIISVVAQSIVLLLIRAYYAAGRTWRPLWLTLGSSVFSIACAVIFIHLFNRIEGIQVFLESLLRIQNVQGSVVVMLSLAYSVGMFVNLVLLWKSFKRDFGYASEFNVSKTTWESISASLVIGVSAYVGLQVFDPLFSQDRVLDVLAHGVSSAVLASVIGVIYLLMINNQEIQLLLGSVLRRVRRMSVINESDREM
jgi:putative peptidoglycan lipid II flippase